MQAALILKMLSEAADLGMVLKAVEQKEENLVYGLSGVQKTLLEALVASKTKEKDILIICDGNKRAKEVWEDLNFLLPEENVLYFPVLEVIPYEVLAQSPEIQRQRLQVLANLSQGKKTIAICSIEALAKKIIPPEIFALSIQNLARGQIKKIDNLVRDLVGFGYERVDQVDSPGQFSLRGGILDLYSILYDHPLRLEFFDDEIDSIRLFDLETQRSIQMINQINLAAAREFFLTEEALHRGLLNIENELEIQKTRMLKRKDKIALDNLTNKFKETIERIKNSIYFSGLDQMQAYFYPDQALLPDYFPAGSIFIFDEPTRITETALHLEKEREKSFTDLLVAGSLLPGQNQYFSDLNGILKSMARGRKLFLSLLPKKVLTGSTGGMFGLETKSLPPFFTKIRLLADEIKEWKRKKYAILILLSSSTKEERLKQALLDCGIEATQHLEDQVLQFGQVYILPGNLSSGAEFIRSKIVIITENEIFQKTKRKQPKKMFQQEGQRIARLEDLPLGAYVVHRNHGIGRYLGVEKLQVGNIERDYLVIKYAGNDKLYVPADQVDLLEKYLAGEGTVPKVHKLGGLEWQKAKTKATASVRKLAEGLLDLYAQRQTNPGFAFSPDDSWMREFEELFPYKETADQSKAIEEVKKDMQRALPMDRLLCGDVGYGKTEVAIRAAFRAVNDGKQVALLVPTTVLAQQHFNTFQERFDNYPVVIDVLSRFRNNKEQKEILKKIKTAAIDIIIGTHRLLSKDVVFRDLGLLVVDEEQRFGVTHKEKLKRLKSEVDVLTLSATPIPRTLHMSLMGIRDMSVIETPPEDRYPIQTYVVEYSPNLIRDAIRRELGRGGQIFYVHNKVDDIDIVAEEVRQLVPEAVVATAHGQMKEDFLEKVMFQFTEQEIDVLICTTIIETGLDISNANTLLIDEADKLGLAQLYQLRGRVGRTNRVAYAYLTYKKDRILSAIAEKRLHAIREFTELGSGFKIAMRDLEIRGAGNLLGAEQHGQIAAVGFDLYCKMLEETIQELKGQKKSGPKAVEIDLEVSAYLDNQYVEDHGIKLDLYQRIRLLESLEEINDLEDELIDRFGDLPSEANNLLKIAKLKVYAQKSMIESIEQGKQNIKLRFYQDPGLDGTELISLAQKFRRRLSFSAGESLEIKINTLRLAIEDILQLLEKLLLEISALVSGKQNLI